MKSNKHIVTGGKPVLPEILFPDTHLTFADFFCGCGGLSLGMIQSGMKCVSAMDFSPETICTYWLNLCVKGWSHLWISPENEKGAKTLLKILKTGETANWLFQHEIPDNWLQSPKPMPCLNLSLYSILDLEPEEWLEIMGLRPGDISVFVGGPPCQGFSTANTNRSIFDERNQLPLRYIHYAKVCKPNYVIIENVPGLVNYRKTKDLAASEKPIPPLFSCFFLPLLFRTRDRSSTRGQSTGLTFPRSVGRAFKPNSFMLQAALKSRSWCVPHLGQVQLRSLNFNPYTHGRICHRSLSLGQSVLS